MSSPVFSFLDTDDLSQTEIESLFAQAQDIKSYFFKHKQFPSTFSKNYLFGLLFFEASTRTRLSFEIAIKRLGGSVTFFDGASKEGTSLIKGETYEDTFGTLHAMSPDMIIIRCGEHLRLETLKSKIPIINAGYGVKSHPTQALLDVFTMRENLGTIKDKNILFVGDISHSRVTNSHLKFLPRWGAKVGVVGPQSFLHDISSSIVQFSDLKAALAWADVVVGLRIQFERHTNLNFSKEEFIQGYQLTSQSPFKEKSLLLHPGPVNWGVEFDPSVRTLPQFKMWEQKQNGVFVRAALLNLMARKNGFT